MGEEEHNEADKLTGRLPSLSYAFTGTSPAYCPPSCSADPFSEPGQLRLSSDPEHDFMDTMWLPFAPTLSLLEAGNNSLADAAALADQGPTDEIVGLAGKQWTKALAEHWEAVEGTGFLPAEEQNELRGKKERRQLVMKIPELEGFEWARRRMVLLIGTWQHRDTQAASL